MQQKSTGLPPAEQRMPLESSLLGPPGTDSVSMSKNEERNQQEKGSKWGTIWKGIRSTVYLAHQFSLVPRHSPPPNY